MQMELQNYILATAPWSWTMKQIQPISSYFCQGNKVCASVFPITPLIKASLHWLLKQVKRTFHSSASLKAHKTSPTSTQAKFVSAVCSAIWNSTCYITELTLVQITAIINVTWLNDHTGTSVASHEPSQLASKDSLKKVTTYVNLFSWMFLLRPWTFSLLQKGKNTCSSFCPAEDLWGVYFPGRQHARTTWMNVGSDLNPCVLNSVSGTWYRDLHFSPWPNFRDLSVELCLSRAQWTHLKEDHPAKWSPMTNTISVTPAYTSSVPEASKLRSTWIFLVFGTECNTNLKANRPGTKEKNN